MVTREQVIDALRPVQDPELQMSVVELDMVRDVRIDGGAVAVTIALTVVGCPLRAEIERRVTEAVGPLAGVESVSVELTVMTDEERAQVKQKVQGGHGQAGHAHPHGGGEGAPEVVLPFADPSSKTRVLGLSSGCLLYTSPSPRDS